MPERLQDTLWRELPSFYREDGKTGFTYRLLGMLAQDLESVEDEVLGLHRLLNPEETASKFLPWLASWVALVLDENWNESKRRRLIREIVPIYKRRGTPGAIIDLIEIYTGYRPTIIEHYAAGWRVGIRSTLGVDTRVYGGYALDAHRFSVVVYTREPFNAEAKERIRRVVLIEKPSWTQLVNIEWVEDIFWRIGVRSTVGLDTVVG